MRVYTFARQIPLWITRLIGGPMISQVLAFYHVPGGTARICLCSDGHTRIFVEDPAKTEGVVFLPEPSPIPDDDE